MSSSRCSLVAVDIDGTLTTAGGEISARSYRVLRRLREKGIALVLATGRPWQVAERLVDSAGGADFVVCSNGALTLRLPGREVIRDVFLNPEVPPEVVRAVRERLPGAGFALEFALDVRAEAGFRRRLVRGVSLEPDVDDVLALLDAPVRKVLVFHDDYDADIPGLVDIVEGVAGPDLLVTHSGMKFIEVSSPGLSKVVALAEICRLLGVNSEDVVAFGDDVNDVEMLRWAGTGVAMANAVVEARAAADAETLSNTDDGVADFLERMLARTGHHDQEGER
jgi:Cof subfamily protein (haloacid dehalogenase superfamily)